MREMAFAANEVSLTSAMLMIASAMIPRSGVSVWVTTLRKNQSFQMDCGMPSASDLMICGGDVIQGVDHDWA